MHRPLLRLRRLPPRCACARRVPGSALLAAPAPHWRRPRRRLAAGARRGARRPPPRPAAACAQGQRHGSHSPPGPNSRRAAAGAWRRWPASWDTLQRGAEAQVARAVARTTPRMSAARAGQAAQPHDRMGGAQPPAAHPGPPELRRNQAAVAPTTRRPSGRPTRPCRRKKSASSPPARAAKPPAAHRGGRASPCRRRSWPTCRKAAAKRGAEDAPHRRRRPTRSTATPCCPSRAGATLAPQH